MGKEEGIVQSKKIKELEADGYYVLKLMKTNQNGIPDLIAIPPNSGVIFVEVKTKKGAESPLQKYRAKILRTFGIKSEVYYGD